MAALGAAGYAYYSHRQMVKQKAIAENLFYDMKSAGRDIAGVEQSIAARGNPQGQEQVKAYLERRRQMESDYDSFVAGLKIYNRTLTAAGTADPARHAHCSANARWRRRRSICHEVSSYIRKWQIDEAVRRAVEHRQADAATQADRRGVRGPEPAAAVLLSRDAGERLQRGRERPADPMGHRQGHVAVHSRDRRALRSEDRARWRSFARPDPGDDRHNWEKATQRGGALHQGDLFDGCAGVGAAGDGRRYNWGESRVIKLLRSMPANPRERNFWKVLQRYRDRVPKETYDYVLSIVSAAVIGENPRLFGFNFDNPLAVCGPE